MIDNDVFSEALAEWVDGWRESRGISSDGKLNPAQLDMFVSDLQKEIINRIPDFTLNNVDPNASLVLYSGADYAAVKSMCANSNGKYYMISQTQANALWNKEFKESVVHAIGDLTEGDPTTLRVLSGKAKDANGKKYRLNQYATDSHELLALDDFLSYNVAEAGAKKGNVIYIVGDGLSDTSVGMLTEIPEVFRETLANGEDISGKLQLATNLRLNKAGEYEFDLVDAADTKLYLTETGDVKLVDFKETIGLPSSKVGEYSLSGSFKDYAALTRGRTAEELADAFKMSQVLVGTDGNIVGHSFDNVSFKDGTKLTDYMTPAPSKGDHIFKLDADSYHKLVNDQGVDGIKNAIDDSIASINKNGDIVGYNYKGTILENVIKSDSIFDNSEVVHSVKHGALKRLYESSCGDKAGAIRVLDRLSGDADIASAVLNKSNGSAVKALDSIDEAKRSVILYLNDDGIEIGHSYKNTGLEGILPDAIPSESKFSIRKMDLDNLPDDVSLSGKIPMYEKLCAADKIQLRYIEGRHLNGEFSDAAVVSVTLDSNGKSKVSYDVNGRVETGEIDAGAIRYDVDMNGKISVKCRDTVDGTAGWKSQVGDMIHDSRIESINGIDRAQFSSLDDALKKLDVSDTSKLFGDSISKISSDNTNSMRFVMDVATGRNNFADSVKLDPVNCSKIGARVGVAMAALDTLGDLGDGIDAIIAYNKFAEGLVNGDYVEASYELGEWGARTAGGTLAGMGAGYATGLVIAALAAGGTVLSGGTVLFVVIGTSMVASTAGSELGAALWDDLNYRVNGYGKRDHTKSAVILSILSKAGISVNDKDDIIEGSDLNDELDGGTGNDTLYGGSGSDKYIFRKGDGNDVIYDRGWDNSHNDKIKFVSGVRASDVKIDRVEHDLVISYGSGDGIVVRNHFLDSDCLIESIVFSDGDSWDIGDMAEILQNIVGTEEGDFLKGYVKTLGYYDNEIFHAGAGDDLVEAYTGDDLIYGEDGSDALYGQWGNDTIIGGTGDDYLCGGAGDDTYVYNVGDGFDFIEDNDTVNYNSDTLVLGEGIIAEKVGMERRDNDLIIQLSDSDFIMVKNAYYDLKEGKNFIENIRFADGIVWRPEDVANRANIHMASDDGGSMQGYKAAIGYNNDEFFFGGAGEDWIRANDGDDTVFGEDGDDVLYGEDGNDVILGGNGKDHILGENGDDIIQGDDGNDNLSGGGGIDIIYGGEGNDEIYGDSDDDMLYGEDGDDEIGGGHGNDVICGGKGNDYLAGDAGDDTYFFDIGDGSDVIRGWYGEDRIIFGKGIHAGNVGIERVGGNLEIRYGESDLIVVAEMYVWSYGQNFVENIEFSDGIHLDKDAINHEASVRYGSSKADVITGYDGTCGYDINETLFGYGGDDVFHGNEGNDTIYGGEGNDTINGGTGDDLLFGEIGNDSLNGEYGDDTYFFNVWDGEDIINEWTGEDRIVFGEGITAENIGIERVGVNLEIRYGESDSIVVAGMYAWTYGQGFVENIEFSDGTVLNKDDINHLASVRYGTDEADTMDGYDGTCGYDINETLYGYGGDDVFHGNEGNDIIYCGEGADTVFGGEGDDHIFGESGDDTLNGEYGDDTYFFNVWDGEDIINEWTGEDRIVFGEGITAENIGIERVGVNLEIRYGESDSIVVAGMYAWTYGQGVVENIEFSDGTVLNKDDINHLASVRYGTDDADTMDGYDGTCGYDINETLYGYGGDDVFHGNEGNDIIYCGEGADTVFGGEGDDHIFGESGDDTLNGEYGDDTYFFNVWDGEDIINEWTGEDRIVFGEGITAENIGIERVGVNLEIRYGESDSIVVAGMYAWTYGQGVVENIEFLDGTVLDKDAINHEASVRYGTDEADTMDGYDGTCGYDINETLYGYGGNDTINANDGNDTIYGGEGNDTINGGSGDDHIFGESGDDTLNGDDGDDTYIFNLGDGTDIINEWFGEDRIVFGEGILIGNIFMEKVEDRLVIRYSEDDSLTVNGAYQREDGARQVEQMELKDRALYNINYSTVSLDLVESYIESIIEAEEDISDEQISDKIPESEEVQITDDIDIPGSDAELQELSTDDVYEDEDHTNGIVSDTGSEDSYCDEEIIDMQEISWEECDDIVSEESDTDFITSEEIDTVIESIIEFEDEYASDENCSDACEYDDSDVDNMVSLAIQDMSESSEDNVCDSDDDNSSDSDSNSEQLWVEE